jgi:hypothetical protein
VLTSGRLLACSIAAVIAIASTGALASPIHRCQQHRSCKAVNAGLGDIDPANSAQVGWRYVHHSPGRWLFFGPGYVFEPGKGILDGPCGLPSSACSDMVN